MPACSVDDEAKADLEKLAGQLGAADADPGRYLPIHPRVPGDLAAHRGTGDHRGRP